MTAMSLLLPEQSLFSLLFRVTHSNFRALDEVSNAKGFVYALSAREVGERSGWPHVVGGSSPDSLRGTTD